MKNYLYKRFSKWLLIQLFALVPLFTFAQELSVKGTVYADDGFALPGASVMIQGTSNGTVTDLEGKFTLSVPQGSILNISFVGYMTSQVVVNDNSSINVTLDMDVQALEEIVVVGYGTVEKSDLTGSVGSIDMEQVQKIASVDVARNIQGKVAGVQVTTNSGAPGKGTTIRVRGVGSFQNANPLFVVDGFLTGDISTISPNDITSMEVLKDASATAIYGSRGANGVIIITTKKGLNKGFEIEVNAYGGIQTAWKKMDLLNAAEFAELYVESVSGPGEDWDIGEVDDSGRRSWIRDALGGNIGETNWQDEVLRVAGVQNYNLSIRGGTQKVRYKVSGTAFNQQGIVHNTYGKRYQGQANLEVKPIKKMTLTGDVKVSFNDYINYDEGTYSSVLGTALRKDPINPVKDPATGHWDRTGLTDIVNPARMMHEQQFRFSNANRIQPGLSAKLNIAEGLDFSSSLSYDTRIIDSESLTPANTTIESRFLINDEPLVSPNESRANDVLTSNRNELTVWQNSNVLSYANDFGKHSINAILGYETYRQFNENVSVDATGAEIPRDRRFILMSYFARLVYSYDNRYLLTMTGRRDGSSKFNEGNKWGTFPSFSAGWNVNEEAFFPENSVVNGLKLRGGYGEIGNQDPIAPYGYLSTLSQGWAYAFNNDTTSYGGNAATQIPAVDIKWEVSEMTNFGIDLEMLDYRLIVSAEYFIKNTTDLLVQNIPVPNFVGASGPTSNAASMTNRGTELTLDFKQSLGEFNFNIGGNISFISNEVTGLGSGDRIDGANFEPKIGMPVTRTIVGEEFSTFYGLRTLGIFQTQEEIDAYKAYNREGQPINSDGEVVAENSADHKAVMNRASPGDVIYDDVNKDGVITADDAVSLGSAVPDFTYGLYLSGEYKSFDLSMSFTGTYGNEIANVFTYYINGSSALDNNMLTTRLDRWVGPGSSNTQPRVTQQVNQNDLFSDRYIEDGSFMRMRNLQIGYTLNESFASKLKMKSLRVYLSADNLLTLTKYTGFDPEIGLAYGNSFAPGVDLGSYPLARTIIIGTNIKF
ncbi:MAG: TonB-dependent receptor [Cyclobacteriaceae bacterium]